jgi:hypothetical protein
MTTDNPNHRLIDRAKAENRLPQEQSRIERRQFQRRTSERTGAERRSHLSPVRTHYSTADEPDGAA